MSRLACHRCGVELQQAFIQLEKVRHDRKGNKSIVVENVKGFQCPQCLLVDTYDWWREQAIRIRTQKPVPFSEGEEL